MATEDEIKQERAFIHDISSPLMIAMGMVESLHDCLDEDSKEDQELKSSKALKALLRVADLVKERRNELIEKSRQLGIQ